MTTRLAPGVLVGLALASCSGAPKEPSIDFCGLDLKGLEAYGRAH